MGGLILSRYECAECSKRHANGSKAQGRCEAQREQVNDHQAAFPCEACRFWPAWADGRCPACGTSPKVRASEARNRHWSGSITMRTTKSASDIQAGVKP